jgi:acyl-CoA synthetase (AMP-forming)/AMP-acid ligase II
MRHASVADAAVVGRKDPSRGEVVHAFIVAREGERLDPDALRDHCRRENLAQWKIPRDFTILEQLPRSPTGKVLKRVLIDQLDGSSERPE